MWAKAHFWLFSHVLGHINDQELPIYAELHWSIRGGQEIEHTHCAFDLTEPLGECQ